MSKFRRLMLPILVVLLLVTSAPAAFADNATPISVRLKDATVPWLYALTSSPPFSCPSIPAGISISPDDLGSSRVKQAIQQDLVEGKTLTSVTDLVTGTAHDNVGRTYHFVYRNHANLAFDGSRVNVEMQDSFTLKGGDVNMNFGFNWRWAYATNSLQVMPVTDAHGVTVDIAVSPFPFATSDGIHEDPGIIPGSWQQLRTQGNLNCDPL